MRQEVCCTCGGTQLAPRRLRDAIFTDGYQCFRPFHKGLEPGFIPQHPETIAPLRAKDHL